MSARSLSVAGILCISIAACTSNPTKPLPPGDGILFIGNSLTYYNDMPAMVQALADSTGESAKVETVGFGNYALIDHWNEGTSRAKIARGGWRVVVLQQGPSSVEYNRDSLRLLTRMFDERIRGVGAATALFSVWPMLSRQQDFPRAIESYMLAAADIGGLLFPVAAAWQAAWVLDPALALYSDGLHPTAEGSYLAAIVIYARLFERTPVGLPSTLHLGDGAVIVIAPATAALLQQAAANVTVAVPSSPQTSGRP